jgi:rubrerythrin
MSFLSFIWRIKMEQKILPAQGNTTRYLEALDIAIIREIKAKFMYRTIASIASSDNLKRKMEFLAAEEQNHRENLEDLYRKISGTSKDFDSLVLFPDVDEAGKIAEMEIVDILRLAMDKETEAHDYYMEMSRETENEAVREMFRYLAEEELTHKRMLEVELKLYSEVKPMGNERPMEKFPSVYGEWWK